MSFLYPRTIKITRPAAQAGVGAVGYGGAVQADEVPVASNVNASIQLTREGRESGAGLPSDVRKTVWQILFKLPAGQVKDRDIVTDDLGRRFKVIGAYPHARGYTCLAEILEV